KREEKEGKDQFARSAGGGHRRDERPDGADPDVREGDAGERCAAERGEEERKGGQRHDLGGDEKGESRERLAEPDGAPVAGREHESVERGVLALGHPGPTETEERRE